MQGASQPAPLFSTEGVCQFKGCLDCEVLPAHRNIRSLKITTSIDALYVPLAEITTSYFLKHLCSENQNKMAGELSASFAYKRKQLVIVAVALKRLNALALFIYFFKLYLMLCVRSVFVCVNKDRKTHLVVLLRERKA